MIRERPGEVNLDGDLTDAAVSPIIFPHMRAKAILLLVVLALAGACRRPRPALIPEISPPLAQEAVYSWKGAPAWGLLFPCAGGVGWISAEGRIVVWDPKSRKAAEVFALPFPPADPPFLQGELLLFQDRASDRLFVLDLARMQVKFDSRGLGLGRVLGAGPEAVVYLDGDRPAVRFWARPQEAFRAARCDAAFFNCHFSPERILVLGRERLYDFGRTGGAFAETPLPQPAGSPFCLDGDSLYYGSGRRLVKYSLKGRRLEWQLKLGHDLRRQPLLFAGAVLACPDDHILLRVNRRGSLLWWQALGSALSFDLQPMSDNLAAVLLSREIKFIDARRQSVTSFPDAARPLGPPLAFGDGLFTIDCQGENCRLLRLGNRYGVDIELEAAPARWLGRSLRFTVQTRNLIKPRWECQVLDARGRAVFSRSATGEQTASLAWVPQQAGKFLIRVRAAGLNREAQNEAHVQVLDPLRVAPRFYLHF